jgi:voltage-gated potassium channel
MPYTIEFLINFFGMLLDVAPILLGLILIISILAVVIGKREEWSISNSLYYGFITATTVGYGDFHPTQDRNKLVAILIAILGLMLTGIVVALTVEATILTYDTRTAREAAMVIASWRFV